MAGRPATTTGPEIELLVSRNQQADPGAAAALVVMLSPQIYRFLAGKMGSRTDAEDMLQDVWLRIHRVRHTYRPSEPLLSWDYAIARRVRVDKTTASAGASARAKVPPRCCPNRQARGTEVRTDLTAFEDLVASLPESRREVLTMLKVNELSLEEVARGTSSTVGAVKQKAHRAYHQFAQFARTAAVCASGTQRSGEMTCHDIGNLTIPKPGNALPALEAAAHLDTCDECRALIGVLNEERKLAGLPAVQLERIRASIVKTLKPVRPLGPARTGAASHSSVTRSSSTSSLPPQRLPA
jgi:RNA polymerase sigma-70 factor, ECF subfamily